MSVAGASVQEEDRVARDLQDEDSEARGDRLMMSTPPCVSAADHFSFSWSVAKPITESGLDATRAHSGERIGLCMEL